MDSILKQIRTRSYKFIIASEIMSKTSNCICMENVDFSHPAWEWDRIQDSFDLFWTHSPLADCRVCRHIHRWCISTIKSGLNVQLYNLYWLVVTGCHEFGIFPWIYIYIHILILGFDYHPKWRTHIFQRGGPTTNQLYSDGCRGPMSHLDPSGAISGSQLPSGELAWKKRSPLYWFNGYIYI